MGFALGCPYGECPDYWCPFVSDWRHFSHDHDEAFMASYIVLVIRSVVVFIILGRHRQRTSGPGAVVRGSRLGSTLSLLHVGLVETASAGGGVLLAPGCGRHGRFEHGLANVSGFLRASVLKGGLNHSRWEPL